MAGRWLDLLWAPGFLCVALILETASGAGDPSTKAHGHIQFSAGGVKQTAMADVSTPAGQGRKVGRVGRVCSSPS